MTKLKVATYLRVSTDDQTIDPQRLELAGYCHRQDWEIVGEWSDVISGVRAARPGLDALIAKCKAGGIDAIVIVKLDRIGRSVLNIVSLVQKLTDMDVGLVCTSQGIDTRKENAAGKMILGVMASFAEFERDILRERTRAGLKVARNNGKILGRPSPTLIPEPRRSEIVAAWKSTPGSGGYRKLAALLGNVSPMTARKLACANTS